MCNERAVYFTFFYDFIIFMIFKDYEHCFGQTKQAGVELNHSLKAQLF